MSGTYKPAEQIAAELLQQRSTEAAAIRLMSEAHVHAGRLEGMLVMLLAQIDALPPLATPEEIAAVRATAHNVSKALRQT